MKARFFLCYKDLRAFAFSSPNSKIVLDDSRRHAVNTVYYPLYYPRYYPH